jgi:hypothetical protein
LANELRARGSASHPSCSTVKQVRIPDGEQAYKVVMARVSASSDTENDAASGSMRVFGSLLYEDSHFALNFLPNPQRVRCRGGDVCTGFTQTTDLALVWKLEGGYSHPTAVVSTDRSSQTAKYGDQPKLEHNKHTAHCAPNSHCNMHCSEWCLIEL